MFKTTEDVVNAYQNLHERPPHLITQLSSILAGEQELTPEILSKMVVHLRSCDYCQLAVEIIAATALEQSVDTVSAEIIENIRRHLERLKEINHNSQVHEERIAAYAELLETHGEKEARKRYTAFAEHLKHCQECSTEIHNTRKALKDAVSAGLIPPFKAREGKETGNKRILTGRQG